MPLTRGVPSLKLACLRNISRNIDKLWNAEFDNFFRDKFFRDTPRLFYVLGPFDCLTSEMIHEMLDVLASDRRLRRSHLHLLLNARLDQLDFFKFSSMTSMLYLVGIRCRKLTKLNLSNCSTATPNVLCGIFPNLPLLRWLSLCQTKSNNQVLATVLVSCKQLQHLDLFACPVTDQGAIDVCQSLQKNAKDDCDDGEPKVNGTNGRVSLLFLNINATKIGSKGAVMFLKTFPDLHILQYADVMDVVSELHRSTDLQKSLKLRTLTATGIKCKTISPDTVHIACTTCLFITEVLFYQSANDFSIQYLSELKHLKKLEITSDRRGDVTFFDGLKPLFLKIGTDIVSLGLYDIQDLALGQLGVLCPNLEKLKCSMAVFNSVSFVETPLSGSELKSIYRHLKNLRLVIGMDGANLSAEALEKILENATKLTDLHFINVDCLTTEMFVRVLEKHGMRELSSLALESCHEVTDYAISRLIGCDNPLESLCLRQCDKIRQAECEGFEQYVLENNLNLNIVWE